jgi:hypothetical protein
LREHATWIEDGVRDVSETSPRRGPADYPSACLRQGFGRQARLRRGFGRQARLRRGFGRQACLRQPVGRSWSEGRGFGRQAIQPVINLRSSRDKQEKSEMRPYCSPLAVEDCVHGSLVYFLFTHEFCHYL